MYRFRMRGIIKNNDIDKAHEVLFMDGRLIGDKILVEAIHTHGGYSKDANIEAKVVMMSMKDVCDKAEIWGNYPEGY